MSLDESLNESLHRVFGTLTAALAVAAVAICLVCCSRGPEPALHTVAEYRADPTLRRQEFARCSNDSGTLGKTPDCINVRQATLLEESASVRDLPPIRLPPPKPGPPDHRE